MKIVLNVLGAILLFVLIVLVVAMVFFGVRPVQITVNMPEQPAPVVNYYGPLGDQQPQVTGIGQINPMTNPLPTKVPKPAIKAVQTGSFNCSDVTNPSVMFRTTDARTVSGASLVYPSGQGSKISPVFAVVLKEPGVIAYGQDGKNRPELQKVVSDGYAYWIETSGPNQNQFVLKQPEGKVTTLSGGQYVFVSFGEGIINLKGYEYLFGQKDRGMAGSTVSRGWNIFIRTDGTAQDLNFRCVVPFENLTQLFPNGKTLSEDWAFQQFVNTHTKAPNCGKGCEEVAVAVIDQKTGLIAVASQVGTSGPWVLEFSNFR